MERKKRWIIAPKGTNESVSRNSIKSLQLNFVSEDKVLDQERKIEWTIALKGMNESVTRIPSSVCI